jgi:Helix-turn-helix domain
LLSISAVLPSFFPTQAPWPIWRGSVAGPVQFAPMSRKAAAKIWHKARAWDRGTRQSGRHGGIIGRTALAVLYTLAFDFLNHRTGRCDPSLDAIAAKAGCCRRTVVNALARLRDLGLLAWRRRCEEGRDDKGRFRLRQRTNAYALLPPSQWRGYRDNDLPPPDPATLGAPERIPDPIDMAVKEITQGNRMASLAALEADPCGELAMALAELGRLIDAREAG